MKQDTQRRPVPLGTTPPVLFTPAPTHAEGGWRSCVPRPANQHYAEPVLSRFLSNASSGGRLYKIGASPGFLRARPERLCAGRPPSSFSQVVNHDCSPPTHLPHRELEGHYPDPFNPQTTIRFGLPASATVRLVVYDMLGRQVRVLVDGVRAAGMYEVIFEARRLPSGTYVCLFETPRGSLVLTMLLVK